MNAVWGNYYAMGSHEANTGCSVGDSSSNDIDYGLKVVNADVSGVYVLNAGDYGVRVHGATYGLHVGDASHYGVSASGRDAGGLFEDSDSYRFAWVAYRNYGVYSVGIIRGTDFTTTLPHPTDPAKAIVYISASLACQPLWFVIDCPHV